MSTKGLSGFVRLNFSYQNTSFSSSAKVHEFDGTKNNWSELHVPVVHLRLRAGWSCWREYTVGNVTQICPARCQQAAIYT